MLMRKLTTKASTKDVLFALTIITMHRQLAWYRNFHMASCHVSDRAGLRLFIDRYLPLVIAP